MNKPNGSEITTSPEAQRSEIGTQHGEHGWATSIGLAGVPAHPDPDIVRRITSSMTLFRLQPPRTEVEANEGADVVRYLSKPAPRKWVAGRVVTLLSHYFVAQNEAAVAKASADDWCDMLAEYPAWAIANACRWWMGRENPHHHRKPLPGDIQDRAHHEMMAVRAARIVLKGGIRPEPKAPPEPARSGEWWSPDEVARRKAFAEQTLRDAFGTSHEEHEATA